MSSIRELVGFIPRQFAEIYRHGFLTGPDEIASRAEGWRIWMYLPFGMLAIILVATMAYLSLFALSNTGVGNHQVAVWVVDGMAEAVRWWINVTVVAMMAILVKIVWGVSREDDD